MAYKFYEVAGVTAPKANHARLSFTKEGDRTNFRTMLNLQTVSDSRFVGERFVVPGTLWDQKKGSMPFLNKCGGNDPIRGWECEEGCGDDPEALLKTLVDVAGRCRGSNTNSYEVDLNELWSKLDQTQFLTTMVIDEIIRHWDGPCGSWTSVGNNYHVCKFDCMLLPPAPPRGKSRFLKSQKVPLTSDGIIAE